MWVGGRNGLGLMSCDRWTGGLLGWRIGEASGISEINGDG